jgi:hypothetical protein
VHGPGARNDAWQTHTDSPLGLFDSNYTFVKTPLSTPGNFVKNFGFCGKIEKLLAFSRVI